eukprot:3344957-Rhodomonas_salina.3
MRTLVCDITRRSAPRRVARRPQARLRLLSALPAKHADRRLTDLNCKTMTAPFGALSHWH